MEIADIVDRFAEVDFSPGDIVTSSVLASELQGKIGMVIAIDESSYSCVVLWSDLTHRRPVIKHTPLSLSRVR